MDDAAQTARRHWKGQEHRAKSLAYGGTSEGIRLWAPHVEKLAAALEHELGRPSRGWQREFKALLRRCKPRDIAATTLWAFVSAIVNRPYDKSDAVTIKLQVGDAIRRECDLGRLREEEP